MSLKTWFYKRQNGWFTLCVISAFAGMICYFSINSWFADKHKLNTEFLIAGIAFTILSLFFIYKAQKSSTGTAG